MINFNFGISYPWSTRWQHVLFRDINTIFENKSIELEVIKTNEIISAGFRWSIRESHAGVSVNFALLGFRFGFTFYDHRHWDHDKNIWEKPPVEEYWQ